VQLDLDVRDPVQRTAGSPAPSHPWILGLVADENDTTATRTTSTTSARGGYSFVGECECPDDCPRDHGNE
jgi:hypothetical protein